MMPAGWAGLGSVPAASQYDAAGLRGRAGHPGGVCDRDPPIHFLRSMDVGFSRAQLYDIAPLFLSGSTPQGLCQWLHNTPEQSWPSTRHLARVPAMQAALHEVTANEWPDAVFSMGECH